MILSSSKAIKQSLYIRSNKARYNESMWRLKMNKKLMKILVAKTMERTDKQEEKYAELRRAGYSGDEARNMIQGAL
jgi:hypothetical protein